jgi:uncharacterized membrane protein YcaP (DUF421 family)
MFDFDWESLFVPSGSLLEIFVRGSVVYLVLFAAMRFLPRRTVGEAGPSDLLILVLIADAVQNGMAGGYNSVPEALLLAAVIFGWALVIDWLDHRNPGWQLAGARPLALIRDGRILRENLKRHLLTEDELFAQLREHGLESPERVRRAYIEGDGQFTVILRGGPANASAKGA